jgi:predicted transcriptional regulator
MNVLEVRIGEPVKSSLARYGKALTRAKAGKPVKPYFGVGFRTMTQFGEVFTPKRWELVAALKKSGPVSIYALAQGLDRHYRNVHKDVTALMEWTVIEKNDDGLVLVPWDEIDVRWPLQDAA